MANRITRIHERIRMNHELLTSELQVVHLIDYLYGEKALTGDDVERIVAEVTAQDKARRFLRIMAHGSEDSNLLFVKKLQMSGFPTHLAQAILNTEVPDSDEGVEKQDESTRWKNMRDWPVEAVCHWLESLGIHKEIVSCFSEQNISGITLANLKETGIQKFCPMAKYGDIDKILQSRDSALVEYLSKEPKNTMGALSALENLSSEKKVKSEVYQKFGCKANASFKYTQYMQLTSGVLKTNRLLEPIHWFIDIQDDDILKVREYFASETIPFICACLNERINGTCHIGVDKDGKIQGIQANCYNFQSILNELIENCFYQDQLDAVRNCIQAVRLVEVISHSSKPDQSHPDQLYVIEVDVIPSHAYCTDEAFFAKIPKQNSKTKDIQYGKLNVFRLIDGTPGPLSGPDLVNFMANKEKLAILRKKQEESVPNLKEKQRISQLREKLVQLLRLNDDVYPIFVISPVPADQANSDDFVSNMQFLNSIERKVVFDFDNASLSTSLYCNFEKEPAAPIRVLILQSTDQNCKDKPTTNTKESLNECYDSSTLQPWIFCNGHQPTQQITMDVHEWQHKRRPDFLKVVEYFYEAIPADYTVVVFLLLSNNYKIMLSAAGELCLKFPNNWVVICETKEISYRLKDYLIKSQHIIRDEEEFDQHCVIGMPWLHVNQTILQMLGSISVGQTELPVSTGGTVEISKKVLNNLGDLEVLSANHLSNLEISVEKDTDKLLKMSREKERLFYQGDEVDWWNFWFEKHVLRRDVLGKLLESTKTSLSGLANETGERVTVIAIYHQPGSGGSTVARNVLWELKDQYRCAVVKAITSDTSEQISQLFKHGEPSTPQPVLLLLDNFDELKVHKLKAALENEAKCLTKELECAPSVPFVLLVCVRCSSESRTSPKSFHRRYNIEHNLSARELAWFKDKYDEMEREWSQNKILDPRVLISFNILRENFSQDYIKRTVPRLVSLVTDTKERRILKYVAFFGIYDPDCQYIPASCFDCFMSKARCFDGSPAWLPSNSTWTSGMSDYLRVLLNDDRGTGLQTKGIRIIHNLLSHEVYEALVPAEVSAAEVMLELLNSEMFHCNDLSSKALLKIVYSLSIKRIRRMDGQYKNEFSPLIQAIADDPKEDKEWAVKILKKAYHLTQNIFVAQHLARFYIFIKDWKSAEEWANTLTAEHPKESVLWNTYGYVFRDQLNHRFQDKVSVTAHEAEESLDLVTNGLIKFSKEQEVLDCDGSNNPCGLAGQGSIILRYIEFLTRIPGLSESQLRKFLLDKEFVPQCLRTWKGESVNVVKRLESTAMKILEELESERFFLQQTDIVLDYENKMQKIAEQIVKTTEGIRNYFGEDSNETPPTLSQEQGVYYRRRRVLRLQGDKLSRILEHWRRGYLNTLKDINQLTEENVKTPFGDIRDLLSFIGTGIALCMLQVNETQHRRGRVYDPLLHLRSQSGELLNLNKAAKSNSDEMEAYLYYAILNWPTEGKSKDSSSIEGLGNILEKWKETNSITNNLQIGQDKRQYTKPNKILFFLGVERGAERILLQKPTDKANLEWFEGVVLNEGQHVTCNIGTPEDEQRVEITAAKVLHKSYWHKHVFFALGFTWSGPLAIDISADKPQLPYDGSPNLSAASPLLRFISPSPSAVFPLPFLQYSNTYMQPRPAYIPITTAIPSQTPIQPAYHDYRGYHPSPTTMEPYSQRPSSTPRSTFRGRRPRHSDNRGGQRFQ